MLIGRIRAMRWLVVSAGMLLLLAVSAPALHRMQCPMKGKARLAWGGAKLCCQLAEPSEHAAVKPKCCEHSHAEAKLSTFKHNSATNSPDVPVAAVFGNDRLSIRPVVLEGSAIPIEEPPPPGRGTRGLARLGAFRI